MRPVLFRVFLLAASALYIGAVAVNLGAQWLLDHPTPENLERGIRWNPENPRLWTAYARYGLFSWEGIEPRRAADAYLRAAAGNPLDGENWDGLATAYMQLGDTRKAEAALRSGLFAVPHSPEAAWRLSNFLLLQGRRSEALPYLQTAAASDPSLRTAVFDLGWKILGEGEPILREIVPTDLDSRKDYLRFLLSKKKLIEAYDVWKEIRPNRSSAVLDLGYVYVDALAAAGMGEEATRVWGELLADTDRSGTKPEGVLLTNGDFEADLPNAGLDWRLATGPGYQIELDNFVQQRGSRSLRVAFDGTSNPNFSGVWQLVPVEPSHDYRFRGYIKTENVTTNSGLRFAVTAANGPPEENFLRLTENRVGTNPWTLEQVDFRTGPSTRVISIAVRRLPSEKLNNLIQGKVWIDSLSLERGAK